MGRGVVDRNGVIMTRGKVVVVVAAGLVGVVLGWVLVGALLE